jgi:hypothetical protein
MERAMSQSIAYTVSATFTDCQLADEWIAWLTGGHIEEVLKGGATDAEILRMDGDDCRYEIRYHFPSREVFRAYEKNHAPRLRAEGLEKFPASRGITYARSTAAVKARSTVVRVKGRSGKSVLGNSQSLGR